MIVYYMMQYNIGMYHYVEYMCLDTQYMSIYQCICCSCQGRADSLNQSENSTYLDMLIDMHYYITNIHLYIEYILMQTQDMHHNQSHKYYYYSYIYNCHQQQQQYQLDIHHSIHPCTSTYQSHNPHIHYYYNTMYNYYYISSINHQLSHQLQSYYSNNQQDMY